jgi:hypothetical protein
MLLFIKRLQKTHISLYASLADPFRGGYRKVALFWLNARQHGFDPVPAQERKPAGF